MTGWKDGARVLRSHRPSGVVVALILTTNGVVSFLAIDNGAWLGVLFLSAALVLLLRRREARIEADALVLKGAVRTRRFPWSAVAAVRVGRRAAFRPLEVITSDGKAHTVDALGTWRRRDSEAHRFAEAASVMATGPQPPKTPGVSRRFLIGYAIVMSACLVLLAIGLATQNA